MRQWDYAKILTSAVYALSVHVKMDARHSNLSESDIQLEYAHVPQLKPCVLGE